MSYVNSDRYLPSDDAPKQDILISLKELGDKRIPGAPMYKRAAQEIERLRSIIDGRPAINAALPQSYIEWSQNIYLLEYERVQRQPS
jgi:hypothetical protein